MKTIDITNSQTLRLRHETAVGAKNNNSAASFADRLREKASEMSQTGNTAQTSPDGLQFSKHAEQRMEQRGIHLSEQNIADISKAVEKAKSKGSRDTVVIGANGAFVVNVRNNVVITTISEQEMKQNIFTNIDSAVFI